LNIDELEEAANLRGGLLEEAVIIELCARLREDETLTTHADVLDLLRRLGVSEDKIERNLEDAEELLPTK